MECSLKRISMIKHKKFALFTDTDGKHDTFEEYQTLIKDNQTDKDKNLIYLYAKKIRTNSLPISKLPKIKVTMCC